ncbi:MAG: hypothetical protein ACRYG2_00465 [Janthinobacterium lividum]
MAHAIVDTTIPGSTVARDAADLIRSAAGELRFNPSSHASLFGALRSRRRGLTPDLEQLYVAVLFHELGHTSQYAGSQQCFEMDGVDPALDFLLPHDRSAEVAHTAWLASALHTTPAIPCALAPEIALVTASVATDVLGLQLDEIELAHREAVVDAFPRPPFKGDALVAFSYGMKHRPDSTFGTVNDDLAHFERANCVGTINSSALSA